MILRKSLTAKFIAAVFVILLTGQFVGTVVYFFQTKSALYASLEGKIKRTASLAAEVGAGPLMSRDYSLIETYMEEITRDDDIVFIRFLDGGGNIVREKIKAVTTEAEAVHPFLPGNVLSLNVPVMVAGKKIGDVAIGYSARKINDRISRNMIMISLYQAIVLLLVALVLYYLFNRNIKKPVARLNQVIDKITLGDLGTPVPDLGECEIGSIAKGITFLTERLSMTVQKLYSTAQNVSMAIKQVNMLYKNVVDGITKQSNAIKDIVTSIRNADKTQSEIITNTERLSNFSSENVSSLLEMKATAEEIAVNTDRLYKATEDSYSVVVEMTQSAKEISGTAHEGVSAVEDTSASVEEVGASIREVEEHARDSAKLAERVKEVTSDTGMLAVVNAVEGMEKITEEVKKSAEIIQHLGVRSLDIEKVLSVIKDVTEQTNLLSLNAAILAAQAGEYGKSFSVVADEISALSDRTVSSTREIAGIVKNIQKDIKEAIRSIDSTQVKVDEGNSLVLKVGDALKDVLTASEHSSEMTKAIQRATEEQSIGLKQISEAIEDIRKMMNAVAKSTTEQEKSLSYLLESSGEVKEVADISKRGTEEQATGTRVISKNIEQANDKITEISRSSQNQKQLNDNIIAAMDQIKGLGSLTINDMQEVAQSLSTLFEEIEILKKEMESFKVR